MEPFSNPLFWKIAAIAGSYTCVVLAGRKQRRDERDERIEENQMEMLLAISKLRTKVDQLSRKLDGRS